MDVEVFCGYGVGLSGIEWGRLLAMFCNEADDVLVPVVLSLT